MVWNFAKPIVRGDFMPGFEGFFYGLNVYRIVSGYLYAVIIIIFAIVAINLWRKSKEASPQFHVNAQARAYYSIRCRRNAAVFNGYSHNSGDKIFCHFQIKKISSEETYSDGRFFDYVTYRQKRT